MLIALFAILSMVTYVVTVKARQAAFRRQVARHQVARQMCRVNATAVQQHRM